MPPSSTGVRAGVGIAVSVGDLTSAVKAHGSAQDEGQRGTADPTAQPTQEADGRHLHRRTTWRCCPPPLASCPSSPTTTRPHAQIARITNLRELIQAMRKQAQERGALAEDFLKYGVYLLGNLAANDERVKEEVGH